MFQARIIKDGRITNRGDFSSVAEATAWINSCEAKKKFGDPSTYTTIVVDLNIDLKSIGMKKKELIEQVRNKYYDTINDKYTSLDIAIINSKAIEQLGNAKPLPANFVNMMAYLDPYNTWKIQKIAEIKACTTMEQLDQIVI